MNTIVIDTLLPITLLIALGYGLRRGGLLAESFWPGAERLSYYVLLPALFVYGLATAQVDGIPIISLATVLVLSTLTGAIVLVASRRCFACDGPAFTSVFQGGIRFNNYIGVTAAAALYGASGVAFAAVANAVIVPSVNILCVLAFARYSGVHTSPLKVARAIVANPLVLACAIGITLRALDLGLPPGIEPTFKAVGQAALPLGLLCVGAALGGVTLGHSLGPIIGASLCKFLLLPALTALLCWQLGVSGHAATIAVLFQALPTASSSYVMARQMGGDAPLMATIIAVQTVVAALVLPTVLALATLL